MGLYNEYETVQLKVGDLQCKSFRIGDNVDISDGIYVGYEGLVVIVDGKFKILFGIKYLFDKYGTQLDVKEIVNRNNPLCQLVKEVGKKGGKKHGRVGVETRNKKRKQRLYT